MQQLEKILEPLATSYLVTDPSGSLLHRWRFFFYQYADDDELHRKLLELQNVFYNMLSANVVEEKQ